MVSFPSVSPPRPYTLPSPHPYAPHAQLWLFSLIVSSHLHLGLPSSFFPSTFRTKILYAFFFTPMCSMSVWALTTRHEFKTLSDSRWKRQPPDMKGSCEYILLNSCGQLKSCGPPACGLGEGVTSPFLKGRNTSMCNLLSSILVLWSCILIEINLIDALSVLRYPQYWRQSFGEDGTKWTGCKMERSWRRFN